MSNSPAKRLFFVYGINLNPQEVLTFCIDPAVVAVARLADYRLGFFGHSGKWDSGEEAALPAPGASLWGVVYAVSPMDEERLDALHRVKEDGSGQYFHYPVEVCDAQGQVFEALTYLKTSLGDAALPSTEYLARLVQGARARELPADYVGNLAAHPSVKASYPVPRESGFMPQFSADGHGCNCGL